MELKQNRRKLTILAGNFWVIEYRGENPTDQQKGQNLNKRKFFTFNKCNSIKNALQCFSHFTVELMKCLSSTGSGLTSCVFGETHT